VSSLVARFPNKPATKAVQKLIEDNRLLAMEPAGTA
jgi:hypothetical protein